MRRWRNILLIIIPTLVVFDLILFFLILPEQNKTNINFVSLKPGFSWEIDRENKEGFENALVEAGVIGSRMLILMSPNFKRTPNGTGFGNGDPAYYVEWKKKLGYDVLVVYTDESEVKKLSLEDRNRILKLFLAHEIIAKKGVQDYISVNGQF